MLQRIEHLESSQAHSTTDVEQLKADHQDLTHRFQAATEDLSLKVQALRLPQCKPAAVRLIYTFELLEHILLFLGDTETPRDLMRAQRVCKQFRAVIDGSTKLQRALYFLPNPVHGKARINGLLTDPKVFEKMNLTVINPLFGRQGLQPIPEIPPPGTSHPTIDHWPMPYVQENAAIDEVSGQLSPAVCISLSKGKACDTRPRLHGVVIRCLRCKKGGLLNGSCRRMYFSQPPMHVKWTLPGIPGSTSSLIMPDAENTGRRFVDIFRMPQAAMSDEDDEKERYERAFTRARARALVVSRKT